MLLYLIFSSLFTLRVMDILRIMVLHNYRIVEITTPTGKEFVKCFELKVRNFLIIEMKIISAFKF